MASPITYEINLSVAPPVVAALLDFIPGECTETLKKAGFLTARLAYNNSFVSPQPGESGWQGLVVTYEVSGEEHLRREQALENFGGVVGMCPPKSFNGLFRAWCRVLHHEGDLVKAKRKRHHVSEAGGKVHKTARVGVRALLKPARR